MELKTLQWTVTVEEDPETGEIMLPIPKEVLEMQGWQEGDELDFTENDDGSWTLTKINKDG